MTKCDNQKNQFFFKTIIYFWRKNEINTARFADGINALLSLLFLRLVISICYIISYNITYAAFYKCVTRENCGYFFFSCFVFCVNHQLSRAKPLFFGQMLNSSDRSQHPKMKIFLRIY